MTCTFSTHRSQAFSPARSVLNTQLGAFTEKQRAPQTHKAYRSLQSLTLQQNHTWIQILYTHAHTGTHLSVSWVGPFCTIILVRDAEALLMTAITILKQLVLVSPQLPSLLGRLLHTLFYYLHGHYRLHFIAVIVTIYLTNAASAGLLFSQFLSPPSV